MSTNDFEMYPQFVAIAKARGVPLPTDLNNFCYRDAPLFHSIYLAIWGLGLTIDEVTKVVDLAVEQGREDCAATLAEFAVSLLPG